MFKIGQEVRVKKNISKRIKSKELNGTTVTGTTRVLYFNKSMKMYEGRSFVVERYDKLSNGYEFARLKGNDWSWDFSWIEIIEPSGLEGAVKLI